MSSGDLRGLRWRDSAGVAVALTVGFATAWLVDESPLLWLAIAVFSGVIGAFVNAMIDVIIEWREIERGDR